MFLQFTQLVMREREREKQLVAGYCVWTKFQVVRFLSCYLVMMWGRACCRFTDRKNGAGNDFWVFLVLELTHPLVSMVCRSQKGTWLASYFPPLSRKPSCPGVELRPGGRLSAGTPPPLLLCSPPALPQPAPERRQEHLGPSPWGV